MITQPCGTEAAYQRHRFHGETPCEIDYDARMAAQRRRRRGRKLRGQAEQEALIRDAVRVLAEAMGAYPR